MYAFSLFLLILPQVSPHFSLHYIVFTIQDSFRTVIKATKIEGLKKQLVAESEYFVSAIKLWNPL